MTAYEFDSIGQFRDREEELAAIRTWFDKVDERRGLAIFGRRRVGKSWLVRAFAHGREADIIVATTRDPADQLSTFRERARARWRAARPAGHRDVLPPALSAGP